MKKIFVILVFVILLISCSPVQKESGAVALFFPLYDITRNVAGDKMHVASFIPAGVEPHDFDPNPSDLISLSGAKVFVGTGINFDGIENRFLGHLQSDAVVISSFNGINLLEGMDVHEENHEEHEEHEGLEENEHDRDEVGLHEIDPHVWVSPKNAIVIAKNIKEGLKGADPRNADYYEQNALSYIEDLNKLDADFEQGLKSCKKDKVLTTHAAFAYLAKDYGFEQVPIYGFSPEAEPTPDQLIHLVEVAKRNDLKYVFYEELVDPRVSQTIAKEVGAKTLALNPAEGAKEGESYISIMRGNLANLRTALECE